MSIGDIKTLGTIIMNIPTIIKQQLFTDVSKVWSWAAHGWTAIADNTLAFKVNAHHFKGIVCIILDEGHDLYEIHFLENDSVSGSFKKPSKKFPSLFGVYCDQMVDLIDEKIERIPAYFR